MIKYLASASLLLAGAYLSTGPALAADPGITDTEIAIGDIEPLTGPPALLGVAASIGHKIAIAEANNAGGINGRKIKYVLEDDGYVTARTIQGVKKVVDVDKAFAMLGISGSGQSIAVMPLLEKAGIPTVIDVAPVKFLWEPPRKNVFVVGQSYEEGIIHLVNYLAEKNPGKKWGLITQDDDYGITVRDGFDTVVKARKLNVVYSGNYKKGQQDFSSDMLQLKESGAEVFLAGGINGRKIKYVLEDDGYVTARTIQGVKKVVDVDKAFAMLGISGSGQSIAVMPLLEKAGIPTVIDVAPVKFLWEPPRKNVFVVGQSYEEGIIHLVTYLAEKNPGKKWGLITQDDDYGITVRDGFDTVVKARKLNVVYSGNYKKGQQDFSSDMLQLKDSGAEVFLAGGIIGENIAMMKELEKLNIKPVVGIFWPGRVEPVLKLMGPAGDGIYAVDYVEPFAGPAGKAFLEKAKGLLPEAEMKGINRYSMTGYAAAKVLIAAIERCGKQPTWVCTIAELEKTKNVETGIMAPISFGTGVRFSNQKLQIMQSEFSTLSFKPVK